MGDVFVDAFARGRPISDVVLIQAK